jgi:hypothetical protein
MAYRLSLFQKMAHRRNLGEDQSGYPRTPTSPLEEKSPAQCRHIVDSQSIKTTGVGGEERGYDGGKKIEGRKRHLLVDTEGFVLKAKVHTAKLMAYEGIKTSPPTRWRNVPAPQASVAGRWPQGRRQGQGLGGKDAWMERGTRRASTQACLKGSAYGVGRAVE